MNQAAIMLSAAYKIKHRNLNKGTWVVTKNVHRLPDGQFYFTHHYKWQHMRKSKSDRWSLQRNVNIIRKTLSNKLLEAKSADAVVDSIVTNESYLTVAWNLHCSSAWLTARGIDKLLKKDQSGHQYITAGWKRSAFHKACQAERYINIQPSCRLPLVSWLTLVDISKMFLFSYTYNIEIYCSLFGKLLDNLWNDRSGILDRYVTWGDSPIEQLAYYLYMEKTNRLDSLPSKIFPSKIDFKDGERMLKCIQNGSSEDKMHLVSMLLAYRKKTSDTDYDAFDDLLFGLLPIEFLAIDKAINNSLHEFNPPIGHVMLKNPISQYKWDNSLDDALYHAAKAYCIAQHPALLEYII